jgi:hypothetical protein
MKFHDYLGQRVDQAGPDALVLIRLHARPGWPDVFERWPEVRAWLQAREAGRYEMTVAEAAWRAYRRHMSASDLAMPQHPPKPVWGIPGSTGTVSDAEPLTSLRDLGYQPRKIGRQIDAKTWEWFGDLDDIVERRKYLIMLWDHDAVTQFSHFPGADHMPVLFARVRRSVDPAAAYRIASTQVEQSVKQGPRWLTAQTPYVGLGAIR